MADEQPPDLEDYSVVKFMEEDGEDNEIVESVEVVSSTWLSSDRKKSFWPPKSIPSDRAGRMAVQHAKPDPATWQNLVIIFVKSYKSASRARKNAKLVANGEEALDDKSTDYGKPRKRKKPSRLIEISDDDDEPSCPIRKRKNNKLQSDSDVPDSDGDIPAPCTNMEALQSKVDKAIAYRQVTPSKKTAKLKPLKTMAKLTQKCSIKDAVKQQGLKFNSAQSAGHQVIKAAGRVLATPCTSSKIGAPLSAELNAIGGGVKLFTDRSAKTKGKVLESAEATPSTRLNTGVINSAPIVDFDTIGEDSGFGDTSQVSLKSPLVDYESDFSANSEHASTSSLYPIEGRCENINYSHDDEENVKEVVQKFDKAIQTVAEKPARTAIHIQTSEKTGHQMQQYEQNEGLARLLKQVLVNQRRIISYVVPEKDQTAADFEELPDLPLKTEDDFDKFETYLNLKSQKQEAVKFFTSLFKEGMDEPKFVGKLMGEILSNSLARCVSWEGTEGTKIPFARSKTCNAIRLAVLKLFESSDLCKAEYKIQRWLNTSAQRH